MCDSGASRGTRPGQAPRPPNREVPPRYGAVRWEEAGVERGQDLRTRGRAPARRSASSGASLPGVGTRGPGESVSPWSAGNFEKEKQGGKGNVGGPRTQTMRKP